MRTFTHVFSRRLRAYEHQRRSIVAHCAEIISIAALPLSDFSAFKNFQANTQ